MLNLSIHMAGTAKEFEKKKLPAQRQFLKDGGDAP